MWPWWKNTVLLSRFRVHNFERVLLATDALSELKICQLLFWLTFVRPNWLNSKSVSRIQAQPNNIRTRIGGLFSFAVHHDKELLRRNMRTSSGYSKSDERYIWANWGALSLTRGAFATKPIAPINASFCDTVSQLPCRCSNNDDVIGQAFKGF